MRGTLVEASSEQDFRGKVSDFKVLDILQIAKNELFLKFKVIWCWEGKAIVKQK